MRELSQLVKSELLRVCVATQSPANQTETFIDAHIKNLPYSVEHIYGYGLNYHWNGSSVRELVEQNESKWFSRGLNLLPRFIEFRIRKRWLPPLSDVDVVSHFLENQQIDVVLAEYGTTGSFITPACAAAGIPLVVHFHGYDASRLDAIEKFHDSYLEMFKYASSIIAVSKKMYADLIALGCPDEKLIISHYGPNTSFFNVTPDYEGNEVLMVGRLTEKKAPYLSLLAFREALNTFPDLKLTVIGEGELEGVCRDLVRVLSLDDHVKFLGSLRSEQIRKTMGKSFLFIQHSVRASNGDCEGTPVAILEAGAAGLPVVSTWHAGIPDVVVNDEGGVLVEERDVAGMAEAIVSFAVDRKKAKQFGQAARKRIMDCFTMEMHINKISNELKKAHSKRG